jgi:hypothetical protein
LAGVVLPAALGASFLWTGRGEHAVVAEGGKFEPTSDFSRGQSFLKDRNYPRALESFELSYKLTRDPRTLSHIVYCYELIDRPVPAVNLATQAIDAGVDTPALRNNRAYGLLKTRRTPEARRMAIADLENALSRDRSLRAAHYNLALAFYERDLNRVTGNLGSADSVRQIEVVLETQPVSAALESDAARIYSAGAALIPDLRTKALELAANAIRRGIKPATFLENPALQRAFAGDPGFLALRAIPEPTTPEPPMHLRLADPGAD